MRRLIFLFILSLVVAPAAWAEVCEGVDSSRYFEDTDCDGVKDAGENYYGLAGVGTDSIGTDELMDNADTPSTGQIVAVDSADSADFEYLARADEIVSDGDTLSIDHDLTTNFVANEHVDHSAVSVNTGIGLSGDGDITATRTISVDYTETLAGNPGLSAEECVFTTDGAASGGFVCEGTTANTNEQLYLFPSSDGADTTNYIALGASDGDALAGDSATAFFDAGEVEDARIVDTLTVSAGTINLENSTMTGLADNEVFVGDGASSGAYTAMGTCDETAGQAIDFDGTSFNCVDMDDPQAVLQTGGDFSATDDAVRVSYVARDQTTDGTQGELFLDGSTTRMTIASDSSWAFTCRVIARRTDADGETNIYILSGALDNNAGTTALVGDVSKQIVSEDTTAWDVVAQADDTNDALVLKGTGQAAKTINWVTACDTTQVTG